MWKEKYDSHEWVCAVTVYAACYSSHSISDINNGKHDFIDIPHVRCDENTKMDVWLALSQFTYILSHNRASCAFINNA